MLTDPRRKLIIPGDARATLTYCVTQFISLAKEAILDHGAFFVALSGGSTPKAIFESLTSSVYAKRVDWEKVHLFWSDERAVAPDHPDSNFHMAMQAGLERMPIPKEQIHRMPAEEAIQEGALEYEQLIHRVLQNRPFDLIMLGMGEDGHTASLFPQTQGLHVEDRLVIANFVPQKQTWRMTMTYACINGALHTVIYVLGASKKEMLAKVLSSPDAFDLYPIQRVGTPQVPSLWIADSAAAEA